MTAKRPKRTVSEIDRMELRRLITQEGITMKSLAHVLDVDPGHLSSMFTGSAPMALVYREGIQMILIKRRAAARRSVSAVTGENDVDVQ